MPDVTPPTPGEVEKMREQHVRYVDTDGNEWCNAISCGDWPCDAARLLTLVDHQRYQVRTLVADSDDARARLLAVSAECARWEYVSDDTYWLDRIRRAATGEQL